MSAAPSQSQDKFILRLPDGMRDQIRFAAEANNRSMNAEIIDRLTKSFEPAESFSPTELKALLDVMERRSKEMQDMIAKLASQGQFPFTS